MAACRWTTWRSSAAHTIGTVVAPYTKSKTAAVALRLARTTTRCTSHGRSCPRIASCPSRLPIPLLDLLFSRSIACLLWQGQRIQQDRPLQIGDGCQYAWSWWFRLFFTQHMTITAVSFWKNARDTKISLKGKMANSCWIFKCELHVHMSK